MFCRQCGKELRPGVKFCSACGTPVPTNFEPSETQQVQQPMNEETIPQNFEQQAAPQADFAQQQAQYEQPPQYSPQYVQPQQAVPQYVPQQPKQKKQKPPKQKKEKKQKASKPSKPPKEKKQAMPAVQYQEAAQPTEKKRSVLSLVLSIVVCFFLTIFVLTTYTVGYVRATVDKSNLHRLINKIDLTEIEVDDKPLTKYIVDSIPDDNSAKEHVTEEQIEQVLKNKSVKKEVTKVLGNFVDNVVFGDDDSEVTSDDIVDIIRKNEQKIYEETDYRFTPEDYESLKESFDDGDLESLVTDKFNDEYGEARTAMNAVFSIYTFVGLCVIDVLLAACLVLLNLRKIRSLLTFYGIAISVPSAIWMSAFIVAKVLLSDYSKVVDPVVDEAIIITAAALAVGILMIIARIIIGIVCKPKKKLPPQAN